MRSSNRIKPIQKTFPSILHRCPFRPDAPTRRRAFALPRDFDREKYLSGRRGGFTGDTGHEIRIALTPTGAFYAKDNPWHASQKLTPLPDGRTGLAFRLNNLVDVKSEILRYGPYAEVLAPPELRTAVRESLKTALVRYG